MGSSNHLFSYYMGYSSPYNIRHTIPVCDKFFPRNFSFPKEFKFNNYNNAEWVFHVQGNKHVFMH